MTYFVSPCTLGTGTVWKIVGIDEVRAPGLGYRMGWSDNKIRKAIALIAAVLWVGLVATWLMGWRGVFPVSGWYLAFMAAVVLFKLWQAFRGNRADA